MERSQQNTGTHEEYEPTPMYAATMRAEGSRATRGAAVTTALTRSLEEDGHLRACNWLNCLYSCARRRSRSCSAC
jgi:hypothetical protein